MKPILRFGASAKMIELEEDPFLIVIVFLREEVTGNFRVC